MALRDRIAEFMKVYSVIIAMYLAYSGIVELSDLSHTFLEAAIWVVLAAVGVYGILTFVVIEGLEF